MQTESVRDFHVMATIKLLTNKVKAYEEFSGGIIDYRVFQEAE